MSAVLSAALNYAKKGFSVIPIKQDKKSFIYWREFQSRKATQEEITAWWKQWPTAMIGLVTGTISGLLVIDCDTKEGYNAIQQYIPDSIIIPASRTPRNGRHLYFRFPAECRLTVGTGFIPGVDFRGEGGYVIAPPSKNGDSKNYVWAEELALGDVEPPLLPDALYNILIKYKSIAEPTLQVLTDLTSPYKMFTHGHRDDDLFHIANLLFRGGGKEDEVKQTLEMLAKSCSPPFPASEISLKIESALSRAERRERNLTEEIRQWVTFQEGFFDLTNLKQTLHLLTKEQKNRADVIILRLKKEGFIEKYGSKAGVYRRVDREFERMDFLNASGAEAEIELPFELHHEVKLYPGNISVVAGSKESGKTAFMLNIAKLMLGRKRVVYLNSEMGVDEFKNRLLNFDDIALEKWAEQLEVFNLKASQTPADFMDGSDTIWIIDFLEIAEDFSKIALLISAIHEKLGKGLAFIGIQKADGKEIGRGADFSREKARLYLSLDWDKEVKMNRIKIIDCKAWRARNPRGFIHHYKLVNGSRIIPQGYWKESK